MASTIFQKPNNGMNTGTNEVRKVMQMLSARGVSAEQMVRSICAQRGIDVNELMQMINERSKHG
jgi:hypothetical protein